MAANSALAAARPISSRFMSTLVSGGRAVGGQDLPVVEAHDRDVVGHAAAALAQGVEHAARHLVAAAEDRVDVGLLAEQHRGGRAAPALRPHAVTDVADEGEPGLVERGPGARRPGPARRCTGVAADVGDPGPAAGDQVLDRHAGRRPRCRGRSRGPSGSSDGAYAYTTGTGRSRPSDGRGSVRLPDHDEAVDAAASSAARGAARGSRRRGRRRGTPRPRPRRRRPRRP